MAREAGGRDNLFGLDPAAVAPALAEANEALLARRDALLAALERVPDPLPDAAAAERVYRFGGQLRAALTEARRAKTGDCAPLRRGQKAADAFFEEVSRPLERALRRVEALLTRAAAPPAATMPAEAPGDAGGAASPEALPAGTPPDTTSGDLADPPGADLPTVWRAARVERAGLDLEALRPLFTDGELDRVVARWLEARGPAPLAGVVWHRVVQAPRGRGSGDLP